MELGIISDFQLLLILIEEDPTVKRMIMDLFGLIFPEYEVKITEQSIDFIMEQNDIKTIVGRLHPFNFENFQIMLSDAFIPIGDDDREPDYNPANEMAKKIADKIQQGREKVHAMQAEAEGDKSLYAQYASILSIGMHMDINIFFNYTPFQLNDAFRRFFSKESSDFYKRLASMPLMDVSKVEEPLE